MPQMKIKYTSKVLLSIAAIILLVLSVFFFSNAFIILAVSILISFIFHPFVCAVEKRGLSRLSSTLIVLATFILVMYIGLHFFIPLFYDQMEQFVRSMKTFSLHKQIVGIDTELRKYLPFFTKGTIAQKIEETITSQLFNFFGRISDILSSLVSIIAVIVIVPFITFFTLKDNKKIVAGLLAIIPNRYFEMSYWIIRKVSEQLGRFVRAWIFDATFVGFSCGFGFYMLGIPNALPLGLIAGCGHLIPYFGPIIGGIPAIIISFIQYGSFSQLPLIIALILTIYALDNGFVQPMVFSKSVDIHPILIMLLIIAGSQFAGLLGMLLAVPTATILKTLVKEIYFAFKNYKIASV